MTNPGAQDSRISISTRSFGDLAAGYRYMPQVQIQITSESVLFLPLSFFAQEKYEYLP